MAALREEAIKNDAAMITERKTIKTGLVNKMLLPKIGGKSKSALLGGIKPLPASRNKVCINYSFKNQGFVTLGGRAPGITYSLSHATCKTGKFTGFTA
jgi:hypothetical protein